MRRGGSALHGSGGVGGQIGNVAGLGGGKGGSANSGSHSIGNVAGLGSGSSHAGRTRSGRVRSRTDSSFTQRGTRTIPRTAGGDPNDGKGGGLVLSRRNLIIGAVGVGALAALGGGAAFISSQSAQNDDVVTLEVPESAVTSSDDLGDASPAEVHMTLAGSFDLEYGTLVWASDDQVAACLVPGETANPLCQAGILSLSSGNLTILLERAQGTAEGFQIYEARATSHGLIWVEADILENSWRVYTARSARPRRSTRAAGIGRPLRSPPWAPMRSGRSCPSARPTRHPRTPFSKRSPSEALTSKPSAPPRAVSPRPPTPPTAP